MKWFNWKTNFFILVCLTVVNPQTIAQENVLTFGIQYKPIFPIEAFNNRTIVVQDDNFTNTVSPKFGHVFGMVVRRGFTKLISFETGINYVHRNHKLSYAVPDSNDFATSSLRIVSYEVPLSLLVYIRLGEQLYMNASMGMSTVMFPSNVRKDVLTDERTARFLTEGRRNGWFQGALMSNIGAEYRTEKKGYFYLGASLHLPFKDIYRLGSSYERNQRRKVGYEELGGSFLTLDLRYFFHEKPETYRQRKRSVGK